MRALDWVVLLASLVSIVAYGLYRSRGSNTVDRYLLAGINRTLRHEWDPQLPRARRARLPLPESLRQRRLLREAGKRGCEAAPHRERC